MSHFDKTVSLLSLAPISLGIFGHCAVCRQSPHGLQPQSHGTDPDNLGHEDLRLGARPNLDQFQHCNALVVCLGLNVQARHSDWPRPSIWNNDHQQTFANPREPPSHPQTHQLSPSSWKARSLPFSKECLSPLLRSSDNPPEPQSEIYDFLFSSPSTKFLTSSQKFEWPWKISNLFVSDRKGSVSWDIRSLY